MHQIVTLEQALAVIAATPKGEPRKELVNKYRDLITITGSNCLLYASKPVEGKTTQERLSKTCIGVLERLNARTGQPDGLGTFGGLGEYATREMLEKDAQALIGKYDNVVWDSSTGKACITTDIRTIVRNNVVRETQEEMQNLGIYDYKIPVGQMQDVPMPGVTDDNYIVNRWNGKGVAFVVTPYMHLLEVDEQLLDRLQLESLTKTHEKNSEAKSYQKMPLFEALKHWGKILPAGAPNRSEDGRDLTYDYRYPHEYIVAWVLASKVLGGESKAILNLATEVQSQTRHLIDFKSIASQAGLPLERVGDIIGVNVQQMELMTRNMKAIYLKNRQNAKGRHA